MVQQFVGRENELAFLNQKYISNQAEFIVIYGRRRIGKTELIHQFTSGKPHLYFQCEKSESKMILREFKEHTAKKLMDDNFGKLPISSWHELFEELVKKIPSEAGRKQGGEGDEAGDRSVAIENERKFIIAIDEFPYLAESDKAISSILQKAWDQILSKAPVMLILCGSSIGMMEREVLSSKSPLFGRRTGQILLQALKIHDIHSFFPGYSFEDIVRIYGVCDGIPAYLQKLDPNLSFIENIEKRILNKNEYLYAEGEFLLKSEFREYRNYFNILSKIARGKRSFNEITNATGLDKGLVSKYLSHLQGLHLVGADLPVTTRTNRSRKARYRIIDNFVKFWFRFIHSNRHEIEEYGFLRFEDIDADFSSYLGKVFEDICRAYVLREYGNEFPIIGAWWNRKGDEIDVVALAYGYADAILGECKWTVQKVGLEVFTELLKKQEILQLETKLQSVRYTLFSKSGFTNRLVNKAREHDELTLVTVQDIMNRIISEFNDT